MVRNQGYIGVFLLIGLCILIVAIFALTNLHNMADSKPAPTPIPTPTPYQFPYKMPVIARDHAYRTVLVGDSIVAALGTNANALRLNLMDLYPDKGFVNYNYGYPSTNLLTLPDRLSKTTNDGTSDRPAILDQGFELIIIESFGYNPLSQFTLSEGLPKQREILETNVRLILSKKPNAALAFMTPIAPDPERFGEGSLDLTPEVRKAWVNERIAYIDNHRQFAVEKGIPVIDVYKASLKPDGSVDTSYISNDHIHPSQKGIDLISQTIANYIFQNKIFPE